MLFPVLLYLYKTNRKLFFVSLLFCIPPVVNDIFSLERIPEAHYYGLGHPNTLRIAGIILVIYFWFSYGIQALRNLSLSMDKKSYPIVLSCIIGVAILFNWNFYFDQAEINKALYSYNYDFNFTLMFKVVEAINKRSEKEIYMSPSLINNSYIKYFSRKNTYFKVFKPTSEESALSAIKSQKLTIMDSRIDPHLAETLYNDAQNQANLIKVEPIINTKGGYAVLIFSN